MYTSGRTVKSSKATPSPEAAATAQARRLARRHLPANLRPTISSKRVAGADGTVRMGTTITFAECEPSMTKPLADAIADLPAYSSMCWNRVTIKYLTEI